VAVLEVESLTKHFALKRGFFDKMLGRHPASLIKAVDDVSFSVEAGEILGVAGESGCGKSTTCYLISKLLEPTSGSIRFMGHDISGLHADGLRQYRKNVQLIFQDPYESLNPRYRVFDQVAEGPRALRLWREADVERRTLETLARVGLEPRDYRDRYPHQMSGGERQRVGIACALVMEPKLVIADEPLSMLDVSIRAGILDLIRKLARELDFSCIYVSHDLSILSNISERLLIMYLGRIAEMGPTERIISAPKHPYAQALINAVPTPDPRYRRPLPRIKGDVAKPIDPPPGCRFAPRCPDVREHCRSDPPPALLCGPGGHCAACHLLTDEVHLPAETA